MLSHLGGGSPTSYQPADVKPGTIKTCKVTTMVLATCMALATGPAVSALTPTVRAGASNFAMLSANDFVQTQKEGRTVLTAVVVGATPFTEVVPSWEIVTPGTSSVDVYLTPPTDEVTQYRLATWSQRGPRTSYGRQATESAWVETDVLVTKQPVKAVSIQIVLHTDGDNLPSIESFYLSLTPGKKSAAPAPLANVLIDVPRKAQMSYEGGKAWCSPTAVSMVLGRWAKELGDAALDSDVPDVSQGVHDPGWNGTGNWSFNTAYAASIPGMQACVTRFSDIIDLEAWIRAGVPVVASVSNNVLNGRPAESADGHLIVIVGFDAHGNVITNDPGRNVVRMTYSRQSFIDAWVVSKRTVYLIWPDGWSIPTTDGPWPRFNRAATS